MNLCPYSGIPWNCDLCPEDECPTKYCKKLKKLCNEKEQCDENLMKAKGCYEKLKQQSLFKFNT